MSSRKSLYRFIHNTFITGLLTLYCRTAYPQEPGQLIMNGNQQYRAGSYSQAIVEYNKAIAKDSAHAVARYNMGVAFYKSKDGATATNWWTDLVRSNNKPVQQQAHYNLGVSASRQYEEVKQWEQKGAGSVELKIKDPSNPGKTISQTFNNKALINSKEMLESAKLQLLEQSIESYKQALRINPNDKQARENLQKALLELKKLPPKKKKEDQSKKNQPQPQQQNQQQRSKMNPKEAERQLKLLQQKEKEVKEKMQQKQGQGTKMPKDW